MAIKYPDTLESNNPQAYPIVKSKQVGGHKQVTSVSDLYTLPDSTLSDSGSNLNSDAIGQTWYVVGESSDYKLTDWTNRKNINGWTKIVNVNSSVDTLTNDLNTEINNRTNADNTLQGNIDTVQNQVTGIINSKGIANGIATLDSNGTVPSTQLPSFVDDIIEVSSYANLPTTGETGKIYVTLDTNLTYRWSGTVWTEVSKSLALGETSSTAYSGDKGKSVRDDLDSHTSNKSNPHSVSATQIPITGYSVGSDTVISSSDTVLTAIEKLQGQKDIQIKPFSFENEIAAANAGLVFPVSLGEYHRNENLDDLLKKNGAFEEFGLIRNSGDNDIVRIDADPKLHFLRDVQERRDNAKYFYSSYYSGNKNKGHSNFPVLYTLTTDARSDLAHCIFGKDPERRADEIKFLHTLPKADLHCHLGGVLDAGELVEVAETLAMEINALAEKNEKLRRWMKDASRPGYEPFAKCDALSPIDWKKWLADQARNLELPKYLMAPALLLCFKNRTEDLDRLIFGDKVKEEQFCGIVRRKAGSATLDFNSYESLGDLQGSSLLKTEKTLRQTVQILLRKAKAQNLRHLEIRCSPMNYVCEDQNGILFSQADVVRVILEELEKEKELKTSLVFIASRHSDLDKIKESIELYHRLEGESVGEIFKKYFRGFDLAGDEQKRSPKDVREEFQEILKDCLNITI